MTRPLLIIIALAVLLVGGALGFAVRGFVAPSPAMPFTAIQSGEVVISPEAGGRTASLRVGTSIDAVCAVAYGETPDLGSLATDQDMGGGPHNQHTAIMRGLKPETTYFYRLQGVGVDGRLYQSPLFIFKTARTIADAGQSSGANLAVGARVVEVSSEYSQAFAAKNAVDGDDGTEWSSRGDGDRAYIAIDLGRPRNITGVAFMTRAMKDGSAITLRFAVTVDGKDTYGPFAASAQGQAVQASFTGQVLRFNVAESTGGNTGAVEIGVYGND